MIVGGFDNLNSARACSPALCTVRQPVDEIGREAVKLLLDIISGKRETGTCLTLPSGLVLRRSCGCISVPFNGLKKGHGPNPECSIFEKQFERLIKNEQTAVIDFLENQAINFLKSDFNLNNLLSSIGRILNEHSHGIAPDLLNRIYHLLLILREEYFEIRQLKQQEEEDQLYNFIDDLRKLSEPDDLREYLNAKLIDLGFKHFFISRYKDNDIAELFYSSIPSQKKAVFLAKQLIPGGLKSLTPPFNLICLPLYETETDLGFFLSNPIESSPVVLETIRSSLCGTFQMIDMISKEREYGTSLEKKVNERTSELQHALHELSLMNEKLEKLS
ncbi:MAG: substrate-binding domain-containing protein, partial [Fibrobacter sp.]|nr:substrate-binding domain-containing protein [Fibrobacter sp.]